MYDPSRVEAIEAQLQPLLEERRQLAARQRERILALAQPVLRQVQQEFCVTIPEQSWEEVFEHAVSHWIDQKRKRGLPADNYRSNWQTYAEHTLKNMCFNYLRHVRSNYEELAKRYKNQAGLCHILDWMRQQVRCRAEAHFGSTFEEGYKAAKRRRQHLC